MSNTLIPQEIEAAAAFLGDTEGDLELAGKIAGFSVTDEGKANWTLAKVAEIEDCLAQDQALWDAEVDRLNAWLDARKRIAKRQTDWFAGALETFARGRFFESDGKTRTIKLPHGHLALRDQPPKWEYIDEPSAILCLELTATELVRRTPEIDKPALRKVATVNAEGEVVLPGGVIVDGIRVTTDATPKFTFKAE